MYISGETDDFPSSGKKLKELLEYCREQYAEGNATVEDQWGLDKDWGATGWYDDDVWLRGAADCMILFEPDAAHLYDWKTGKSFGNEVRLMQQTQLYACIAFMLYPKLEYIDVTLAFLDDGKLRTKHFERGAKINALVARFTERGNRMTNCVDFAPTPNLANCKYCPFGPGGTNACMYGVSPL